MRHITVEQRIKAACRYECQRQGLGPDDVSNLFVAYKYASDHLVACANKIDLADLFDLDFMVNPDAVGSLRTTPVSFDSGVKGVNLDLVSKALTTLLDVQSTMNAMEFAGEFVLIYPFAETTERIAFVLYNLKSKNMLAPNALPLFFGAAKSILQ